MSKDKRLKRDTELDSSLKASITRCLDLQKQIRELQEEKTLLEQQQNDIWNDMTVEMHCIWILDGYNESCRSAWSKANPGWKATRSGIQRIKK